MFLCVYGHFVLHWRRKGPQRCCCLGSGQYAKKQSRFFRTEELDFFFSVHFCIVHNIASANIQLLACWSFAKQIAINSEFDSSKYLTLLSVVGINNVKVLYLLSVTTAIPSSSVWIYVVPWTPCAMSFVLNVTFQILISCPGPSKIGSSLRRVWKPDLKPASECLNLMNRHGVSG